MSRQTKLIPKFSILPSLPLPETNDPISQNEIPLSSRLKQLIKKDKNTADISIDDGAKSIPDRDVFDVLSHRDDVPGALGVREVKYLVVDVDTDTPQIYFLNTNKHQFHYNFAYDILNVQLSISEFNRVTYFSDERKFLAGTILAHDSFERQCGSTGLYSLEFWPTDPVKVNFVVMAFQLAIAAMPFANDKLAYHPSGAIQEELFNAERDEFEQNGVNTILTEEIFAHVSYSPLNLGVGFGKLRLLDGSSSQPASITDIVIFKTLPNDLSHVAGVLSEEPQTPLSHINLKAKQNDTPNAYLRGASSDERIVPLLENIVRFEVTADDIEVRRATTQEMEEFLNDQRPGTAQIPVRDLIRQQIVALDNIGHADFTSVGAKAANVAELRKFLEPGIVPNGFAVPFYFYDQFMIENGFYDEIRDIIKDNVFKNNPQVREQHLKDIRKMIKRADIPSPLYSKLGDMHARFPENVTPRCRSSTNNEDLVGFNGAGLYNSYTHRKDEGHISKSIKQVWASLWTYRAFEERQFYRIDHFHTAMGVLVHPNFDDERANGVALTKNIYFPSFKGFYINVQIGEALVTNPGPNVIPEELLIMEDVDQSSPGSITYEIIRIRNSSLSELGKPILSEAQIQLLTRQMELIQEHFKQIYRPENEETFAMDLEFKIDKLNQLVIKQARPWVD